MIDKSNGYEGVAEIFIAGRGTAGVIGREMVRQWAKSLPPGSSVLDIGCGSGFPISDVLVREGLAVSGLDASPSMMAVFGRNFPDAPAECAAAEDSSFFDTAYDAVIAWGLLFLLTPDVQHVVINKVARVLKPNGQFLFTAPEQACTWDDAMTGLPSQSLGRTAYRQILEAESMALAPGKRDEGDNFYYFATKL